MAEQQSSYFPSNSPAPVAPNQFSQRKQKLKSRKWREQFMRRYGLGLYAPHRHGEFMMPDWLIGKSIVVFLCAFIVCQLAFGYTPAFDLILVAVLSVFLFFYLGDQLSRSWAYMSEKDFLVHVFVIGLVFRLVWVIYMYDFFNPSHFGNTLGDGADTEWYLPFGKAIADWVRGDENLSFKELSQNIWLAAVDDIGYPIWLAIDNLLCFGLSDVLFPMIVKALVGSYCSICIYHIAKRHFGIGTARIAALFVMLNPNMIYWCGTMMKEAEMVFLCCLAVDKFDETFSSGNRLTFSALLPGMLAGLSLFFFRTALGMTMFLAVFTHIVFVSHRVMSIGKKVLAGTLVAAMLAVGIGDRIVRQANEIVRTVKSDSQQKNMEWRENRIDAKGNQNKLITKYAGATVFAPLIFTIPFPTFNEASANQLLQIQLSGGYYIKNILSFFVILVMLLMLVSGEWRKHVFIIAYTVGYLVVLTLSSFAQSGRFHMPIWAMLMLFAAYGIQLARGNARIRFGLNIVLVIEIIACIGWNWFKLKGRGLI